MYYVINVDDVQVLFVCKYTHYEYLHHMCFDCQYLNLHKDLMDLNNKRVVFLLPLSIYWIYILYVDIRRYALIFVKDFSFLDTV